MGAMTANAPGSDARSCDVGFEDADGRTRLDELTAGTETVFLQESTMISRRFLQSMLATWSRGGRRGVTTWAQRCRRRPGVERMESRALLSTIAQIPVPTPNAQPESIVVGPDGNLWFTEPAEGPSADSPFGNKIGMINPTTHAVTEFTVPTQGGEPFGITAGPDGNIWFTEERGDKIGMINPATDAISEFAVPTPNALPTRIAVGPDGNLWFTEMGAKQIGMINPATDAISEFPVPFEPFAITAGPDGNLWFTDAGGVFTVGPNGMLIETPDHGNLIGMFNATTHAVTEFAVPTLDPEFGAITLGPDGNLWFTEADGNKIGSIDPTTHDIVETDLPTPIFVPIDITTGPDGNLWFTEQGSGQIGTINPVTRSITETDVPGFIVRGITTGPDGNLWFTEASSDEIGVLTPPPTLRLLVTAVSPTIVAEKAIVAGKGPNRHIVGFELDYNGAVDPTQGVSAASYTVTQFRRHRRQLVAQPVRFRATYDATAHSVTLTLSGRPKFGQGGRLEVTAGPPRAISDAASAPGDDRTFAITPRGSVVAGFQTSTS